jgi:AraC-like DNA-binding protein
MTDAWLLLEIVLRGVAIGALAASGVAFIRGGPNASIRVAGILFYASIVAYVLNSSPAVRAVLGPWSAPVTFLSLGGGGFFWLFVFILFEDHRVTPVTLIPAAVLTVLGLFGVFATGSVRSGIWIVHNLIEVSLSVHALYVIYRSWRGDLVEARRRLRGPFIAIVTLYTIALSGIEIGESVGVEAPWYSLAGGATLAIFCLAGSLVFLEARTELFGAATAPPTRDDAEPRLDTADRLTLDRLAEAMGKGEAWRREGLTIGTLADEVGTPEHRLRRLINDHLGHRNFAAFVNARRIEAAKGILCDPAQARTTVAAIAFDLGFGSLGPFNRAFREATGATPTQWRREALEKTLSNSEISL